MKDVTLLHKTIACNTLKRVDNTVDDTTLVDSRYNLSARLYITLDENILARLSLQLQECSRLSTDLAAPGRSRVSSPFVSSPVSSGTCKLEATLNSILLAGAAKRKKRLRCVFSRQTHLPT